MIGLINKLNKVISNIIKNKITNWVAFISTITAIIGFFDVSQSFRDILNTIFVSTICLFLIYCLIYYFNISKTRQIVSTSFYEKSDMICKHIHSYFHEFRYLISKIENPKNNNLDSDTIKDMFNTSMECMQNTFDVILQDKCSICIKILEVNSIVDSNILQWKFKTFIRSSNTDLKRIADAPEEPILIKEKSDYFNIICSINQTNKNTKYDYFVTTNLKETIKTYEDLFNVWQTSRENPFEYYNAIIVMPIKSDTIYMNPAIQKFNPKNKLNNSHIIGFLCIDIKDAIKDTDKEKLHSFDFCVEIAKAFADSLYIPLSKLITLEINQKEEIKQ